MQATFSLVFGLIGLLTLASLLLPLARRLNFPYTVLLALVGGLLGVIVVASGEIQGLGILGDFLNAVHALDITSEVIFFVFLPALIFESALNINARHLLEDIGPILVLAVLGVLISTITVGTSIWVISDALPVACLLIGAIVSATDPVAVVATFKHLGAPKRLTTLAEGESLFNDATAIVAFTILAALLMGGEAETFSVPAAVGRFLVIFLGGILIGLAVSALAVSLIGRLRKMPPVEITLTLCLAYLAYLLAEHYLHVSGVMAVVAAGLVMSSYGRTAVTPETWQGLTETWEQLSFWANSLIFFLVGLLIPHILTGFTMTEVLILSVLILAALVARTLVLYGLLPVLEYLGLAQRVSLAFRTVMLWGGLRGAISLALALVVLETPGFTPEVQNFVVVMVTGFVLFTLFINAPTMPLLIKSFGLDKLTPMEKALRNRVMALSLSHIRQNVKEIASENDISPSVVDPIVSQYQQRLTATEKAMRAERLANEELQCIGLTALTNRELQLYLERFQGRLATARITRILLTQTDTLLDGLKTGGVRGYQQAVEEILGFGLTFRLTLILQRRLDITAPLATQLGHRFEALRTARPVVRKLTMEAREKFPLLLGEEVAREMERLLTDRLEAIKQAQQALRLQYPEHARAVQKRHLAQAALRLEEADYQQLFEEQMISGEVFSDLMRDLDQRARTLARRPRLDLGLEPEKLVARVPFFADLGPDRIKEIARLLKPQLVIPGERIVRKGETGEAMYFISSGAVEVAVEPKPVRLGSGEFFGEIALLTRQPRNADVTAIGYCQLLVLYVDDFHPLMDTYPDLRETITRTAQQRQGIAATDKAASRLNQTPGSQQPPEQQQKGGRPGGDGKPEQEFSLQRHEGDQQPEQRRDAD